MLDSRKEILQVGNTDYNVVILRPIVFGNICMLHIQKPVPFARIPTLRLEAMRGLSLEKSNFAT